MFLNLLLVPLLTIPVGLLCGLLFKVMAGMWTRVPSGSMIAPFTLRKLRAKRFSVLLIVYSLVAIMFFLSVGLIVDFSKRYSDISSSNVLIALFLVLFLD